jgi:predicted  nucleic acid-binding Zn-ribbon protein
LKDAKAANEDELKGKEGKLSEMQSEKNKLNDKLETVAKEKLDLEGKMSKLSAQLADTIKNLNEMSTKYVNFQK